MFDVSWPTAERWADRHRTEGPAGMADRSSRPHSSPHRTPAPVIRRIVHLRWKKRLGPMAIADRLSHVDRATGEPIRRYEHHRPRSPA